MKKSKDQVWFIYDGECPICRSAANAFMIKKTVGTLNIIDARTQKSHPVMIEVNNLNLNLDDGMVIKLKNKLYHGADVLHVMALIGSNSGIFNQINYFLFRSKILSKICYPFLRFCRNFVLLIKGVQKIN